MPYKMRVKEMTFVKARDLMDNPRNWRIHDDSQRSALKDILDEVGIGDVLVAYNSERCDGALTLIDGHLRKGMDLDQEWPIAVLDIDDDEADILLASLDPLAAMARTDREKLAPLLEDIAAKRREALQGVVKRVSETQQAPAAIPERPTHSDLVDRFPDADKKGTSTGNANWFYVEFYQDSETFQRLQETLAPYMKTGHEIQPQAFRRMVDEFAAAHPQANADGEREGSLSGAA
jgi:hypothetical protein